LAPASFIIGPNNCGKTTVIDAIDALLSLKTEKVTESDFRIQDDGTRVDTIEITGIFTDISNEISQSRGFKGRVINDKFTYKKTYKIISANKPIIESITYPYKINSKYTDAKKVQDLLDLGINQEQIEENLSKINPDDKLPKGWERDFIEVLDYETSEEPIIEQNPGGFPSNVNSKLPRVIRIPSLINIQEIESSDKKYVLGECLSILFEDLLAQTSLAKDIQAKLT